MLQPCYLVHVIDIKQLLKVYETVTKSIMQKPCYLVHVIFFSKSNGSQTN